MKRNIATALGLLAYTASARPAQSKYLQIGDMIMHARVLTFNQARLSLVQPAMVRHTPAVLAQATLSNAESTDTAAMPTVLDPPTSAASMLVWTYALRPMNALMSPTLLELLELQALAIQSRRFLLAGKIQESGAPDCPLSRSLIPTLRIAPLPAPLLR